MFIFRVGFRSPVEGSEGTDTILYHFPRIFPQKFPADFYHLHQQIYLVPLIGFLYSRRIFPHSEWFRVLRIASGRWTTGGVDSHKGGQ